MIRLIDKYLTTALFGPLARRSNIRKNADVAVSILMYHSVSNDSETEIHPYFWVNTSPEIFAIQMRFLKENDYRVISLSKAVELLYVSRKKNSNIKYVVITFDDGFRDFYQNAFPILKKYGFTATVFLPTNFIDNHSQQLGGKDHLSWDEVLELHHQGVSFGSHTVSHPQLKTIGRDAVRCEIEQSKKTIECRLGTPVEAFSYPFAFPEENKEFMRYLTDNLATCGYKYGVSTRIGRATSADHCYFLKRLPVNTRDDSSFFRAKLEGGYDWMHSIQLKSKVIRSLFRNDKHSN